MTICKLMIEDFQHGTGRFDDDGEELYSKENLIEGLNFADWLLQQGLKKTPTPPVFDLKKFVEWGEKKLDEITKKEETK